MTLNTLSPNAVAAEKEALKNWAQTVHGYQPGEAFTKENFLTDAFWAISCAVQYNKQNALVRQAVRNYPDLIPRCFTILTILHGAYTAEPNKRSIMSDLIGMLDDDLIEQELEVCTYAKNAGVGSFFPELVRVMETIRNVYESKYLNLDALPPTSHQAYTLYVLNCADKLTRNVCEEEMYGHLSLYAGKLERAINLTKPSS